MKSKKYLKIEKTLKSQVTGEAILNELPTLPGEPNDGSKKDPEKYNLMPVCKITRCKLPMMPAHAEFFACNHAETLDYLPFESKCELRCKPGYRLVGPQFVVCVAGGWLKDLVNQVTKYLRFSKMIKRYQYVL